MNQNQNQCVPSSDLDEVSPIPPPPPPLQPPRVITSTGLDTSLLDYEVAELTWENGQLTMHCLGRPRVSSKSSLAGAWLEKPATRTGGTLECIVNQAFTKPQPTKLHGGACEKEAGLVPSFDHCGCGVGGGASVPAASVSMTMDALVPTANGSHNTRVGSCSGAARVPVGSDWSESLSGSTRRKRSAGDTCEIVGGGLTKGLTSTSLETSPENAKTVTVDDHDSVCHSRPQKEGREEEENWNKASAKSSMSTKRCRAAAIHNQSERKRRDKINQRMKTLQKLVPNSSKTDKASMLDEVIDYLKQLQAQVQMMSRMSMPASMMMPMAAIQQQLQMSMMSPMGMAGLGMGMGMGMAGMGMGLGMDHMNMGINPMAVARPGAFMPSSATWDGTSTSATTNAGVDRLPSQHQQQQAMVPADPFTAAFLACQAQPMTMDTYSRMAAIYQQLQQQLQQPSGP